MIYIVGAAIAAVVGVFLAFDFSARRKERARDARRDERQRIRIRDWTVWEWIHGRSGTRRITYQPDTSED